MDYVSLMGSLAACNNVCDWMAEGSKLNTGRDVLSAKGIQIIKIKFYYKGSYPLEIEKSARI